MSSRPKEAASIEDAVSLTYGQTVSGTIEVPGQVVTYTFAADAGDVVLVSYASKWLMTEIRLYDPGGTLLKSDWGEHIEMTATLSATGTHTISVGEYSGASTGDYGLHLQRLNGPGNATALSFGQVVTGTITLLAEMDAYTFLAEAGDWILIRSTAESFPLELRLYDPDGKLLNTPDNPLPATGIEITQTLPSAGVYTILASDPDGTLAGPYAFYLQRLNAPGNARTLSYGQTATGTITPSAEMDTYTFLASAGDTIHISVTRTSGSLWPEARLYRPDGSLLDSATNEVQTEISRTLLSAGTYTLLIGDSFASSTGAYDLHLEWLGNVGTILALTTWGPRNVSPGQTADYAIEYGNLTSATLQDIVIVARLPWDAQYVANTGGGLYWWERHQVVWKLGNIPPRQSGLLSVRVRYDWGLPDGQQEAVVVVAAGRSLPNPVIDADEYLAFTPITVVAERNLAPEEVDALLAADSELADLLNYAQDLGFRFDGAAYESTLSDGSQTVQFWLLNLDNQEVAAVIRHGETRLIYKYSATAMAILDREGGLSWNFETGAVELLGTWAESGGRARLLGMEVQPSFRRCMFNCIVKKVPSWVLAKKLKLIRAVLRGWDCIVGCGLRRDPGSCLKCAAELKKNIPGVGESVDTLKCVRDCRRDPKSHVCTEDKRFCGKYPGIWIKERVAVLQCDEKTGFYDWLPMTLYWCDPTEHCVNGECVPDCRYMPLTSRAASVPTPLSQMAICLTESSRNACATSAESTIAVARDPNAKYGPGDVLPGQTITYVLEYENEGEGIAYGVYVEDKLPQALDESTLVVENGGVYIPNTRSIIWDIGELQPGEGGNVRFRVQVPSDVVSGTEIINTATVFFPSVPEETSTNLVVSIVRTVAAYPQTVETTEEVPVVITLTGATVGAWPLSYTIVSEPLNGTLTGTPPVVTYAPVPNFEGLDRFTFRVSNALTESAPAEVTILVHTGSDNTPPEVMATAPVSGAVDVPVFTTPVFPNTFRPFIWVGFSEPVSATTVTTETLFVYDEHGQRLSGHVLYDGVTNSARFLPAEPLRSLTTYTVTVTSDILDTSGNPMPVSYEWYFRTKCILDFDNSKVVDIGDVQAIADRWRLAVLNPDPDHDPDTPNYETRFDLDGNGIISIVDIMRVAAAWGNTCG